MSWPMVEPSAEEGGREQSCHPNVSTGKPADSRIEDHVDVGVFLLPAAQAPWLRPPDPISPLQSFSREVSFLKWVIVCQK